MDKEKEQELTGKNKILTVPNAMSAFRILLIPVMIWLYIIEKQYILTVVVLLVSGLTDMADGFVARHFHQISNLGKILDPIADKLTQIAVMFCLVNEFPQMLLPLIILVIKECIMGITGAIAVRKSGAVYGAEWHGKVATWLLDITAIVHVIWHGIPQQLSYAMIAVTIVFMLISLPLYVIRNSHQMKETKEEATE